MAEKPAIPFNAALIEAFAGTFLSPMYDNPQPTPAFHREGWELYCSDARLAGIAAPREHAKSTAFTHDFALAAALFRFESHILIVSATEKLALAHLGDISKILHDSEDIREEFGITGFPVDAKGEIVVTCADGHEFRIVAASAGQKLRGMKWNGRRPGLILCDDMEEDEQVESKDQRDKFSRWVLRALLPIGRRGARIRWHGTILHPDSFLASIMRSKVWKHLFYSAHAGFDDFGDILWPEQFPPERLQEIRQVYIDKNDAAGYSQEYLNNPLDSSEAYLRRGDFLPMLDEDYDTSKLVCAAADFAISKADRANRTSLTVGGKDLANVLHYIDQRVGRWDSLEIVDEIFSVADRWSPDIFFVEGGQIWNALQPTLWKEMARLNRYINFEVRQPIRDKASRGRAYQRRMRAGQCRFDKQAEWYPSFEDENLRFTGTGDATLDDQFDSAALLALGFETLAKVETEDFDGEEELEMRNHDPRRVAGRSAVTGY